MITIYSTSSLETREHDANAPIPAGYTHHPRPTAGQGQTAHFIGSEWVLLNEPLPVSQGIVSKPEPRRITNYALLARMTSVERIAVQTSSSAELKDWLLMKQIAPVIDLDSAELANEFATLTAAGVLVAGRAAEILDAPVIDLERP